MSDTHPVNKDEQNARQALQRFSDALATTDISMSRLFTERRHVQSYFGQSFEGRVWNVWLQRWESTSERDKKRSRRLINKGWTPPPRLYQEYVRMLDRSVQKAYELKRQSAKP